MIAAFNAEQHCFGQTKVVSGCQLIIQIIQIARQSGQ
jgi:hypothetical protein